MIRSLTVALTAIAASVSSIKTGAEGQVSSANYWDELMADQLAKTEAATPGIPMRVSDSPMKATDAGLKSQNSRLELRVAQNEQDIKELKAIVAGLQAKVSSDYSSMDSRVSAEERDINALDFSLKKSVEMSEGRGQLRQ